MKGRERRRKRVLQVKRMFAPDRMSATNLQVAYEKLLPPECYRILREPRLGAWPKEEQKGLAKRMQAAEGAV